MNAAVNRAGRPTSAGRFWTGWGLAFLGWPLGGLASLALVGGVETPVEGLVGGAAAGAVVGLAQWLALRTRAAVPATWITASGLGLGVGLAASVALVGAATDGNELLARGAVTGLVLGALQWTVLRRLTPRAWLWVPTLTLGWPLGWAVTRAAGVDLTPNFAVFGTTGALASQLLAGLVLAWLLADVERGRPE